MKENTSQFPTDAGKRKAIPLLSGVLDYFPDALIAVARVSKAGNDQHNPGEPLHWARGKSMDQGDCLVRHLLARGSDDIDGLPHSAKMAWRALALLQIELEEKGAPIARGTHESVKSYAHPSDADNPFGITNFSTLHPFTDDVKEVNLKYPKGDPRT